VPLILAARKHYSVDVFTALYVTPLVFEFLSRHLPDLDSTSEIMAAHYGLVFRPTPKSLGQHVVFMWGNDFHVDPGDVPLDLRCERSDHSSDYYPAVSKVLGGGDAKMMTGPQIV
jgi:PAP2 superfamily C-terminal